jgi:YD repeat-containing protein
MKQLAAMLATVILCGNSASAQEWNDYVSQQDLFKTTFPGEPAVRDIAWPSEYGAVFPARVYSADVGQRHYSVTVVDYTDSKRIHEQRTNKTEADSSVGYEYWRIDMLASIDYAATQFRRRGGDVTFDAWAHIDRVPGHQLQITNPDHTRTYAGMYLHKSRLYIIEATVPERSPPQGMFQQGLKFIDANGQELRYAWDENNNLVPAVRRQRPEQTAQ